MNQTAQTSLSERFEACNHTELYQLCRTAGIPVLPDYTRQQFIELLIGEVEPEKITEADHPIDALRHALMGFVEDHWAMLEPQLTCPAKTRDPRSCFGCIDGQVITCLVQNPENEHLIEIHRPRRED